MQTRKELVEARRRKGWSQEDLAEKLEVRRSTVSEWERGVTSPYPTHIQRLCEVFSMTPEELGLHSNHTTDDLVVSGKCIADVIKQCATGIEVCRSLSYEQISADNMATAQSILVTYVSILQAVQYMRRTAPLLAQIYQIRRGNAYHLEGSAATLFYGEEAVHYARIAEDATILATTLHELASVYEWPLPGLLRQYRHRKSLALVEEAVQTQETRRGVPLRIQAWNYIGQAKFRALNGLKQDAYTSIGRANEVQGRVTDATDTTLFNPVNLVRQAAIAHSYLGEQSKAVNTFLEAVDINDPEVKPTIPMSDRLHISLLSEVLYSTLRLPMAKKDKDLSVKLWKASLSKAALLRSATYYNEAANNLNTMEAIWPDDPEVNDLRDLLVPWE